MTKEQVNLVANVDAKTIRREVYNGAEHWIVPSYTLPANVVMNGGLYPASEIDKHYQALEGRLAPCGHPVVNGKFVSASSPEGINLGHIGAWNRNVKKVGNRVYSEKWINVDVANQTEKGRAVLERCAALERGENVPPIHTSVALFLEKMPAPADASGYAWVANIQDIDHDAILLDEPGAATPDQGVGLMVNTADAVPLAINAGALKGESYREREKRLDAAARAHLGDVWVIDFTQTQVVVSGVDNDGPKLYSYTEKDGTITLDAVGTPVAEQKSWVARLPVVNHVMQFFKTRRASLFGNSNEDAEMTPEEKAELIQQIGTALAANVKEQLAPITAEIAAVKAAQADVQNAITANSRAAEKTKRDAVAAKLGEIVANSLTGEALDAAYAKCADADKLTANRGGGAADDGFAAVID